MPQRSRPFFTSVLSDFVLIHLPWQLFFKKFFPVEKNKIFEKSISISDHRDPLPSMPELHGAPHCVVPCCALPWTALPAPSARLPFSFKSLQEHPFLSKLDHCNHLTPALHFPWTYFSPLMALEAGEAVLLPVSSQEADLFVFCALCPQHLEHA